jgi:hypothetical protein
MMKVRFKPVTDRRSDCTWRRWRKGDAERAGLARGLPAETTRSGKGIAAEGHLGSWTHVSKLVGQKKV